MDGLEALSEAGEVIKQLRELQTQMKTLQDDVNAIRRPRVTRVSPEVPDAATRIEGTTWAEEMDLRDPLDEEEETDGARDEVRLVEVGHRTEQHLVRSFVSINNSERRQLRNAFALPKVAITKTPSLDPVMASQCSKNTKTNDKALARVQALTLDAIGPLTELLEKLNSEETELTAEEVGYAMESAITLLGNASSQISGLRRQKVLEEYNKDLLSFAKEREATFIRAAPQLFGPQFPKDAADHLEQVAALKRAKSSTSHSSGFHRAPSSQWSGHRPYVPRQRPKPYTRPKTTHANARKATQAAK